MKKKFIPSLLGLLLLTITFASCKTEPKDKIKEGFEQVGEGIEDGAEKVGESIENTYEKTKNEIKTED